MPGPSSSEVISLYRALIRYGKQLQYTDKNLYFQRVRREFDKNRSLFSDEKKTHYFEKGQEILKRRPLL